MRTLRALSLCLALAGLSAGCVISKGPLLGPEGRVVPFASGTRFAIYERENDSQPWKRNEEETGPLVADANHVVRALDKAGQPRRNENYTFYPSGPNRYLVQAQFGPSRYAYGVLEVRDGEGILVALQCWHIEADLLARLGVTVRNQDCDLDTAADPVAALRAIAAKPAGGQFRYVPVPAQ